MKTKPYKVELDTEGCPQCQHDAMWTIAGPGDIRLGQSWGDFELVDDICEYMNDAYAEGRASYAQQILDTLKKDEEENAEEQPQAVEALPPTVAASDDDIPF